MPRLTRREAVALLLGLGAAPAVYFGQTWKANAERKGQEAVEPFRIAGNFYYVGAHDVTAYLLTSEAGHVLIDAGYQTTAPFIMGSIARLGFDIRDVKVLLTSAPRADHAGGLAAIQQASGAQVWASEASAAVIAAGGDDPDLSRPMRTLMQMGFAGYPPVRVDRRFKDGDTLRLGPIAITAHGTGGAARGSTSYAFIVRDGDRELHVVSVCSLAVVLGMRYEGYEADLERSIQVLRSLPVDIWVASRARAWGRYRKFSAQRTAKNPVDPFIDPEGYRAHLDAAEAELRQGITH